MPAMMMLARLVAHSRMLYRLGARGARLSLWGVAVVLLAVIAVPNVVSWVAVNRLSLIAGRTLLAHESTGRTGNVSEAVALSPRSLAWREMSSLERGNGSAAVALERIARQRPGDSVMNALLSQAYERSRVPDAIPRLADFWVSLTAGESEQVGQQAVEELRGIGERMSAAGRRHDAFAALHAAWKLGPGDRAVVYYLGTADREVGDPRATLYAAWQALRSDWQGDASYRDAPQYRLSQLIDANKVETDVTRWAGAVQAAPSDAGTHLKLGWALFMAGAPLDRAIGETKRAIDLSPAVPNGYLQVGDLLRYTGGETEAVSWYKRGLDVAASPPLSAVEGIARAWYAARKYEEAIPYLAQAVAAAPNRQDLWDLLAASYWYTFRRDEAIDAERHAASPDEKPEYAFYLARLYEDSGLLPDALATYRRILDRHPQYQLASQALTRLATVLRPDSVEGR